MKKKILVFAFLFVGLLGVYPVLTSVYTGWNRFCYQAGRLHEDRATNALFGLTRIVFAVEKVTGLLIPVIDDAVLEFLDEIRYIDPTDRLMRDRVLQKLLRNPYLTQKARRRCYENLRKYILPAIDVRFSHEVGGVYKQAVTDVITVQELQFFKCNEHWVKRREKRGIEEQVGAFIVEVEVEVELEVSAAGRVHKSRLVQAKNSDPLTNRCILEKTNEMKLPKAVVDEKANTNPLTITYPLRFSG